MSLMSIEPGMKLAVSISSEAGDDYLAFLKQMGVEWVALWTTIQQPSADYFRKVKQRFANAGLQVFGFGNGNLHNQDAIVLGLENRDAKIEELGLSLSRLESRDSRVAKLVSQIIAEEVSMNAIDGFVEQGSVDLQ